MKLFSMLLITLATLILFSSPGFCTPIPIDISGAAWEVDPGVTKSGGVVSFSEADIADAFSFGSFFNWTFSVDPYATFLTFDYTLTLGQFDSDDYLQFDLQTGSGSVYTSGPPVYDAASGSGSIDLSAYRNLTVALAWTLGYGDFELGTTATLSNLQLDTAPPGTSPIPEPSGILLIGFGLLALTNKTRKIFG